MGSLTDIALQGLFLGAEWGLVAVAFGLVVRVTRIFHLALGGMYGLASYVFLWGNVTVGLPFVVAILLAMLSGVVLGIVIDRFVYQRITGIHGRRSQRNTLLNEAGPFVASLGAMIVLNNLALLWFGASPLGGHPPDLGIFSMAGARSQGWDLVKAVSSLLAVLAVWLWLGRTRTGQGAIALGQDAVGASVVGIDERAMRRTIFGVTGAAAGLGGALAMISHPVVPGQGLHIVLYAALITLILPNVSVLTWWASAVGLGILHTWASVQLGSGWSEIVVQVALLSLLVVSRLILPQVRRARRERVRHQDLEMSETHLSDSPAPKEVAAR